GLFGNAFYGRPDAFEITAVMPPQWVTRDTNAFSPFFGTGNIPYDPTLLNDPFAFNIGGGIYGAQVGRNPETINGVTVETNTVAAQSANLLNLFYVSES